MLNEAIFKSKVIELAHIINNYMCRISNIDYILPQKKNICNIFCMCAGEVLLNRWKQGNTLFS